MRIGITGHLDLTSETVVLMEEEFRAILLGHETSGLVGVTCLARGADQVFARTVLRLGGTIEVVLPASDYRDRKVGPGNLAAFDDLISRARSVHTMRYAESNHAAYTAASEYMLTSVEALVAVWDGAPGVTAETVAAARGLGLPTTIVWPEGAARR
ncbi:hypothetical protein ACFWMR_31195 [Amycolatopsis thailandensis]|uniref:hypothetical protein n=1 Tax=Amycolatopsis thailandensis TaxID=589330 RepID=UPI0036646BD4